MRYEGTALGQVLSFLAAKRKRAQEVRWPLWPTEAFRVIREDRLQAIFT